MAELSQDQIQVYLDRIGLAEPLDPTAESLSSIQVAHLHAVPFENLDIVPLNQQFGLDLAEVYDKVVLRRRGGFCFELNGLLAALLESLGYQVERMAAWFADEPDPDPFDHLVLAVTVPADGSRWYVDVGAGRTNPDRAIPIDGTSSDGRRRIRLANGRWLAEGLGDDSAWSPILSWGLEPHPLDAFAARCAWFQTAPESFFRKGPICTVLTTGGRVTLSRRTLITTTTTGERTEQALGSDDDIAAALRSIYGIELQVDDRWR
jgi:N-hydroxyarylamine O-acetyltransferase